MLLPGYLKALLDAYENTHMMVRDSVAVLLLALVSWVDFFTPLYISLTGFYFVPIYLAIWYGRRVAAVAVIVVSVGISLYMATKNLPAGAPFWHSVLAYGSFVIVFSGFGALIFYLKSLFTRLQDESQTDALTGLRSRRSFLEMAQLAMTRNARSGNALTLALVDIDNFKHVNDTQGHATGDALLIAVSRCMSAALRESDIVGRLGGDEFALLLPETGADEARAVLERVHDSLRTLLQSFSHVASTSMGAVTAPDGMVLPVIDIMERADAVMYTVKNGLKDGLTVEELAADSNARRSSVPYRSMRLPLQPAAVRALLTEGSRPRLT